jgi:hypothetical protein
MEGSADGRGGGASNLARHDDMLGGKWNDLVASSCRVTGAASPCADRGRGGESVDHGSAGTGGGAGDGSNFFDDDAMNVARRLRSPSPSANREAWHPGCPQQQEAASPKQVMCYCSTRAPHTAESPPQSSYTPNSATDPVTGSTQGGGGGGVACHCDDTTDWQVELLTNRAVAQPEGGFGHDGGCGAAGEVGHWRGSGNDDGDRGATMTASDAKNTEYPHKTPVAGERAPDSDSDGSAGNDFDDVGGHELTAMSGMEATAGRVTLQLGDAGAQRDQEEAADRAVNEDRRLAGRLATEAGKLVHEAVMRVTNDANMALREKGKAVRGVFATLATSPTECGGHSAWTAHDVWLILRHTVVLARRRMLHGKHWKRGMMAPKGKRIFGPKGKDLADVLPFLRVPRVRRAAAFARCAHLLSPTPKHVSWV